MPKLRRLTDSLSPLLRQKAQISFTDPERFNWHYTPRSRRGIAARELSTSQLELLHAVLRTGLSDTGYQKAKDIIELEPILGRIEGSGNFVIRVVTTCRSSASLRRCRGAGGSRGITFR